MNVRITYALCEHVFEFIFFNKLIYIYLYKLINIYII